MKKKAPKKYWYFTKITECVLCGHSNTYKERKTTKKPKNRNNRYCYNQMACSKHFL